MTSNININNADINNGVLVSDINNKNHLFGALKTLIDFISYLSHTHTYVYIYIYILASIYLNLYFRLFRLYIEYKNIQHDDI